LSSGLASTLERFIAPQSDDILLVDAADLDSGVYDVPNHRRAQIERSLSGRLRARICVEPCALTI
jgi:hypothetical protein